MSGVNKAVLVGHLGRDPVGRDAGQGRVVSFSVATSETWRDKASGERKERTEWHNVVVFDERLGKIAEQYLRKGSKVFVEGQMRTRKWTHRDGTDRWSTEVVLSAFRGDIVLLDKAERGPPADETSYGTTRDAAQPRNNGGARPLAQEIDDDIPF